MFFACYVFHAKLSKFQCYATDTCYVNTSGVTQRTIVNIGSLGSNPTALDNSYLVVYIQ